MIQDHIRRPAALQAPRDSAYDRLMTAKAEGRRAMEAVAKASGPDFQHRAYEFAVLYEVVR